METKTLRRGSKQKRAVLNAARLLANHPTAEEIFFKVREEMPRISLSTVYRNLGVLVEEKELLSISGSGPEFHYDYNVSDHCHVQCRECGEVGDINYSPIDFIQILPEDTLGFLVDGVCVKFTGVCDNCIKKVPKGERNEHQGNTDRD